MSTLSSYEMDSMVDPGHQFPCDRTIPSDPAEAQRVQDEIEQALRDHHFSDPDIFSIRLAVEEALVNAIKHGNQLDRNKKVRVAYQVRPDRFEVLIADEGPGFDPDDVPDPTLAENLERPSGRGLMLMRHYMNEVVHRNRGTTVFMAKVPRPSVNGNGKARGRGSRA